MTFKWRTHTRHHPNPPTAKPPGTTPDPCDAIIQQQAHDYQDLQAQVHRAKVEKKHKAMEICLLKEQLQKEGEERQQYIDRILCHQHEKEEEIGHLKMQIKEDEQVQATTLEHLFQQMNEAEAKIAAQDKDLCQREE